MEGFLKQSTAYTFRMGPFLDSTNANDEETGLTIDDATVKLSKAGGALAAKNDNTDPAHDANGFYTCVLNSTDTGTLGLLKVFCHPAGALAVWHTFMILPANVYDSLVGGSDKLDVNAAEYAGVATESTDTALATVPDNFSALDISVDGEVATAAAGFADGSITNATFADGAISSRVITTAAAVQAASVASGDVTARRGDTVASLAITTTAHDWDSGKSMRLLLKSYSGYTNENDTTDAYLGLKLTFGGAVGDGLYLLNGDTRTESGDLDDGSLVRSSSTQTLVNIGAAAYAQLRADMYNYEIQVAESDGSSVVTIAAGVWTVTADVVRATS